MSEAHNHRPECQFTIFVTGNRQFNGRLSPAIREIMRARLRAVVKSMIDAAEEAEADPAERAAIIVIGGGIE